MDKLRLDQHLLTQRLDDEEDERLVAVKVVPKFFTVSAHLSEYIVVVKIVTRSSGWFPMILLCIYAVSFLCLSGACGQHVCFGRKIDNLLWSSIGSIRA